MLIASMSIVDPLYVDLIHPQDQQSTQIPQRWALCVYHDALWVMLCPVAHSFRWAVFAFLLLNKTAIGLHVYQKGPPNRGGVGHAEVGWIIQWLVGHAVKGWFIEGWGGSSRGGVGNAGVGWCGDGVGMWVWGGVGHAGGFMWVIQRWDGCGHEKY